MEVCGGTRVFTRMGTPPLIKFQPVIFPIDFIEYAKLAMLYFISSTDACFSTAMRLG